MREGVKQLTNRERLQARAMLRNGGIAYEVAIWFGLSKDELWAQVLADRLRLIARYSNRVDNGVNTNNPHLFKGKQYRAKCVPCGVKFLDAAATQPCPRCGRPIAEIPRKPHSKKS